MAMEISKHHQSYRNAATTPASCVNINWGCIVALVGGNEMKLREREIKRVGEQLETKVKEFWDRVKSGTPPEH